MKRAAALLAVATGAPNNTEAPFGLAKCPCLGFSGVEGTATVLLGERYVPYPGDLGSRCSAWDDGRQPDACLEGQEPGKGNGWCKQSWCYVDPRKCDLEAVPSMSSYLPTARYQGMPLFYSYATCGNQEPEPHPDAGQTGCDCIGFDNRAGSVKARIDGAHVRYPGEVGGSCKAWDLENHPACAVKGSKPSFCSEKWCFVDPCKCSLKTPPKESVYLNATLGGRSIYYSYQTCGANDTFTEVYNRNACTIAGEEECGKLPKCAWTGTRCLGKELVVPELCSAAEEYNGTTVEDLRSGAKLPFRCLWGALLALLALSVRR